MLLPHVITKIHKTSRYTAGISFSDRSIRYIEVEKGSEDTLTLSAYGYVTIPFDVMQNNKVIKEVEFANLMKKLATYVHTDARVIIRDDGDEIKAQSLRVAGFSDVRTKKGIDILRGVFVPWGADTVRIGIFANYDTTHVLKITQKGLSSIAVFDQKELFSVKASEIIRTALGEADNQEILLAGKYANDSFIEQLELYEYKIKRVIIWQNLFDFSRYIPEVAAQESYEYTVPAGLVVSGIMEDLGGVTQSASQIKQRTNSNQNKTSAKDIDQQPAVEHDSFFVGLTPLTKLAEDKRKVSEKEISGKHKKLLKKIA